MDFLSVFGIILAIGAILLGQALEGGHASALLNLPALLIVLGGTFGTVLLESSFKNFKYAIKLFLYVIIPPKIEMKKSIDLIIKWSHISRKQGLLALEPILQDSTKNLTQKALQLLIDGAQADKLCQIMEVELESNEEKNNSAIRVYESMGGYASTVGIIGAVMGLIHVMSNLSDPSIIGTGIAVAFVATIYGVAFANLIFLLKGRLNKKIMANQARIIHSYWLKQKIMDMIFLKCKI